MSGFTYRHTEASEAQLSLSTSIEDASINCYWPLDRSTNEWFSFRLTVPLADYKVAVAELRRSGKGTICDAHGASVIFSAHNPDRLDVDMTSGSGPTSTSLQVTGVATPLDL